MFSRDNLQISFCHKCSSNCLVKVCFPVLFHTIGCMELTHDSLAEELVRATTQICFVLQIGFVMSSVCCTSELCSAFKALIVLLLTVCPSLKVVSNW